MLNAMREGAKSGIMKFILLGLMVMAGGGLILMDVGGFFRGGVTQSAIAKIDGTELPVAVFDRTVRRVLSSQSLDMETAYKLGFINQILRNEISSNVMQRAATDMGLQVGDELVIKQINRLVEGLVTDGVDKKAALTNVLRNQGLTENEFVRMIQAEMTTSLLRTAIQVGTNVPPGPLADDLYQHNKEQRTVNYIFLPHSGVKDVPQPAEEILLAFYQAGQEKYAVPETKTFSVATLSKDSLAKTLDISDEELRQTYDQEVASYQVPERRVMEQAVFEDQASATAAAEAVKGGKTLKDAAGESYIGEEKFEKDGLLKEIGDAAFAAQAGDTIGPIQTAMGWHVLKLKDIVAPETQSFESVKENLKKDLIQARVADELFATGNLIEDKLAGGMSLEEVAAEMELKVKQYGPITADGSTPDNKDGLKDFGPDWGTINTSITDMQEGETAPIMELADGNYAVVRVDAITPKTYKPFEEVKGELAKVWMQDQREVANKLRSDDAVRSLNASQKSLNDIASAQAAEIKTITLVRDEQTSTPMNDAAKTLFFGIDQDQYGVAPVEGGFVVGRVTGTKLPDIEKASKEDIESYKKVAQQGMQGELMQIYFNHLQSAYDVKINQRLLEQTYGPQADQPI